MRISTAWTAKRHPAAIGDVYDSVLAQLGAPPDLLFLYGSALHAIDDVVRELRARAPHVPLHGGTSCQGIMTQAGAHTEDGFGLGLLGVSDPAGRYGVGAAVLGDDPAAAARQAMNAALEMADCPGQAPAMVWMTSGPGNEEALLDGISSVVGADVPIAGGSSADNTVSGGWLQIANDRTYREAVVVTALFPSTEVMFAFHSGYEPTDARGIVTKAGGYQATASKGVATRAAGRVLEEIDHRPAAVAYNEWVHGDIADVLGGGSILARTTLHPLGRVAGQVGSVPYYQLSHPDAVTANGGLSLFSSISTGDEIVLMQGTVDSLVSRAGRVASSALETYTKTPDQVAGALVVYCAGCMLAVRDWLDDVVDNLREALPGTPFLGLFTFGEQGCFLNGENRHGNLMISVLLFSR